MRGGHIKKLLARVGFDDCALRRDLPPFLHIFRPRGEHAVARVGQKVCRQVDGQGKALHPERQDGTRPGPI